MGVTCSIFSRYPSERTRSAFAQGRPIRLRSPQAGIYPDYRSASPRDLSRSLIQRKKPGGGSLTLITGSLQLQEMAKPVYALVGEDSFRQLEELGRILTDLPGDPQRSDYDGETAELADVLDDVRSFAMFGGGKVVVIRSADEFVSRYREQLENYLASPSNSGTLVLRLG